ncbi:MAG: aminopeptidase [Burkholderiaceae bacterium]|nr:aminopeptidase [Burkholderiales bacterium]MCZ8097432.1 aminopeptidase [Burkholderiales bacterium]MCZ8338451.1 aminopeptidase [Burkholderiaceae bacterium]
MFSTLTPSPGSPPRSRRPLSRLAAVASGLAFVLFGGSVALPAVAAEPGELAAREMRHIAKTFPGRMAGTPREDQTARYVADRLLAMGYKPSLHRFGTRYTFRWINKPERGHDFRTLISTNVIAERRGTSGKQIIVGAHVDSRTPTSDTDLERRIGGPELEGLDANASGTGALLELAQAFSKAAPTHTIQLIAFGAEEIGLHGAIEVVNRMTPKERARTLWMVNIDGIVTGDGLYFHAGPKTVAKDPKAGAARDRALAIAAKLGIAAATNPGLNPEHPKGTGCCSDQAAFDDAGIPVVNVEATHWELGDKDGYQQTSVGKAFPNGYSWHLVDIDNRAHLEANLPAGRVDERARDVIRILVPLVGELAGGKR